MKLMVTNQHGEQFEATQDNCTVVLFKGRDDLDHVDVTCGDGIIISYDREILLMAMGMGMPVTLYSHWPEWAIDRKVAAETRVDDLDRLLDS